MPRQVWVRPGQARNLVLRHHHASGAGLEGARNPPQAWAAACYPSTACIGVRFFAAPRIQASPWTIQAFNSGVSHKATPDGHPSTTCIGRRFVGSLHSQVALNGDGNSVRLESESNGAVLLGDSFCWNGISENLAEQDLEFLIRQARYRPSRKSLPRGQNRRPNEDGEWSCGTCGTFQPKDQFYKSRSAASGIDSICKTCTRHRQLLWSCTLRGNMLTLIRNAKGRARERGHICSLTLANLLDMLWDQRGKCFYSGVSLEYLRPHSHWRMSLERLDNQHGYSVGNVALVACEFNTFSSCQDSLEGKQGDAQWSKQKVLDVLKLRDAHLNEHVLGVMVEEARAKCRPSFDRTRPHCRSGAAGEWLCSKCHSVKAAIDFYHSRPKLRFCKGCDKAYQATYRRTLRGNVIRALCHARARSKGRNQVCTLSLDDILDMLLMQGGRCYYSGMPMECTIPKSHWRMSLERVDNENGYTKDNCVLVAREFNTSDFSRNRKNVIKVHGTAQWSRQKVQYVFGGK